MVWSIEIKKTENVMIRFQKRHIKGEKHIVQMDFAEYVRKTDASENNKVYYGRFLRNGLHERYCYVKVDEMCKILKSLLTNRFWSRDGIG